MSISRRDFVKSVGATGAAVSLLGAAGCDDSSFSRGEQFEPYVYEGELGPADTFQHAVASGDPLHDRVILWTRVTIQDAETVDVYWEISPDPDMRRIYQAGYYTADASRDFTVKVDVTDLNADTFYYYRFTARDRQSVVARTRTMPAPNVSVDHLRFGFASCASLAHGYFHVYRALSERNDLDVILHLGDYIYEYESGGYGNVREYEPAHEIVTLEDYRKRHAQYKRDPDVQAVHREYPFITIWDDHETADNSFRDGANNHNEDEGAWEDRKNAGIQSYSEWMPIRDQVDNAKIWRQFKWGDLVDILMLDTRLWARSEQGAGRDQDRVLLGDDQFNWMADNLKSSTASWRVLGQQVMFGQFLPGGYTDMWDGYNAERNRVLDLVENDGVDNLVVLTGDIHTAWAMDVPRARDIGESYDPETSEGSLAVEFVVSAVTSPGLVDSPVIRDALASISPHIKYTDLERKGFNVVSVSHDALHTDFYVVGDVTTSEYTGATHTQGVRVGAGTNRVEVGKSEAPALSHAMPRAADVSAGAAAAGSKNTYQTSL